MRSRSRPFWYLSRLATCSCNLTIAALHTVHKSLGVTLRFICRFARATAGGGQATFVAKTGDDGVPEALENLYREDADWNVLLADLSYDAINPQIQLSALVSNLEAVGKNSEAPAISTLALDQRSAPRSSQPDSDSD